MEVIEEEKREKLLILSALAAGIIFDYLFNGKAFGLSYPVYVLVLLVLFWGSMRKTISVKKGFGWFVLIGFKDYEKVTVLVLRLAYRLQAALYCLSGKKLE